MADFCASNLGRIRAGERVSMLARSKCRGFVAYRRYVEATGAELDRLKG